MRTRAVVWAGASTPEAYAPRPGACPGGSRGYNETMEILERVKADRRLRWSAYAAAPFVWLALALFNPLLLLIPPLIYVALERAMAYGMIERHDPVPDPDDF